jgi:hypothetical protein
MIERRRRRSGRTNEALRHLLDAVKERSEISSIAIIDGRGLVLAGSGPERELLVLGAVAGPAASGGFDSACERLTEGTDVMSCPVEVGNRTLYLAALGERVRRMPDAVRGVARILRAS